jgi:hypothetical protein
MQAETTANLPDLTLTREEARRIVSEAVSRHFIAVRARIPEFVDRTFAWAPAWRINRLGVSGDLIRAPLNAALVLPHFGLRLSAAGFDRAGRKATADWLRSRQLFLKTRVAREIEWRIWTQLLQLPYRDGRKTSTKDALAEAILNHPVLLRRLALAQRPASEIANMDAARDAMLQAFHAYGQSRAAAAEVASAFACVGAGAALLNQFTPSVLTLGPALANLISAKAAAASGGTLTALWLGLIPVKASALMASLVTASAYVGVAAATAVSGAVTDPVQRYLGLHRKRLHGLVDTIELALLGDAKARLIVHDHYAGRMIDLTDALLAVWRFAPR